MKYVKVELIRSLEEKIKLAEAANATLDVRNKANQKEYEVKFAEWKKTILVTITEKIKNFDPDKDSFDYSLFRGMGNPSKPYPVTPTSVLPYQAAIKQLSMMSGEVVELRDTKSDILRLVL